jgi:diaminopimelate epimerase
MNFTKVQGAGNDFILVETKEIERDWPQMARTMCDRHFGIGADGLLLLLASDIADFQMRMFNPDGFEAEACGNGLRCLAKYIVDRGLQAGKSEKALPLQNQMSIETIAGVRVVRLNKIGESIKIQVGMGIPKFGASDIPVVIEPGKEGLVDIKSMLSYSVVIDGKELQLNFVSTGNPHAVYFWQKPVADFPLSQIGPKVEHLAIFPNRVNFEVANVVSRQQIESRVWERGAGETLACGTGACAIAVAAQLYGYTDNEVDIKLPGGILQAEWDKGGEVFLSGSAEIVFTGDWR